MSKKEPTACIYCGATRDLTRDHVPPKNLFGKPRPLLIKVPSCRTCNEGASKDDEYFRLVLCVREGSGDHPDARAVREAALRSLTMPEKRGLRRLVTRTLHKVERRTESGLYLGEGLAYEVDVRRLDRVVARTVKGMFYRDNARPLPPHYTSAVYSEDGLRALDAAVAQKLHDVLIGPALQNPVREIGAGVMRYWSTYAADDPNASGWVFEFYGHVRFYGVTLPVDEILNGPA